MRIVAFLLACAAAGCGFRPSGDPDAGGPGDGDAGPDAAPFDAIDGPVAAVDAGFTLADCPPIYSIEIGASRYRFRGPDNYYDHYGACLDDVPGFSHLAVVSDVAEAMALAADLRICNPSGNCDTFWTGVYAINGRDFVSGTGETPFYTNWAGGQPTDFDEPPTGMTFSPGNRETSDQTADIEDDPGTVRALCECDGRQARPLILDDFD